MKMQGSYTVEAAAVFGLIMGIILLLFLLGFQIYHETLNEIYDCKDVIMEDPGENFRRFSLGKELLEEVLR